MPFKLVIGFDPGMEGTGVAFGLDATHVYLEEVFPVVPGGMSRHGGGKTRTCLLLNRATGVGEEFGDAAYARFCNAMYANESKAKEDYLLFDYFKAGLQADERGHVDRETKIRSTSGEERPLLLVLTQMFKLSHKYVMARLLQTGPDLTAADLLWVITVPAIWSPMAQALMREAALAGFGGGTTNEQIIIGLEPEAAALYCRAQHQNLGHLYHTSPTPISTLLKPGVRFLVMDCGALTVDCTRLEVTASGAFKEIGMASGGIWGGHCVEREMIRRLERIFGRRNFEKWAAANPHESHLLKENIRTMKHTYSPDDALSDITRLALPESFQEWFRLRELAAEQRQTLLDRAAEERRAPKPARPHADAPASAAGGAAASQHLLPMVAAGRPGAMAARDFLASPHAAAAIRQRMLQYALPLHPGHWRGLGARPRPREGKHAGPAPRGDGAAPANDSKAAHPQATGPVLKLTIPPEHGDAPRTEAVQEPESGPARREDEEDDSSSDEAEEDEAEKDEAWGAGAAVWYHSGCLHHTRPFIEGLYKFAADRIVEHLGRLLAETEGLEMVFLVGGFADSHVIRKRIDAHLERHNAAARALDAAKHRSPSPRAAARGEPIRGHGPDPRAAAEQPDVKPDVKSPDGAAEAKGVDAKTGDAARAAGAGLAGGDAKHPAGAGLAGGDAKHSAGAGDGGEAKHSAGASSPAFSANGGAAPGETPAGQPDEKAPAAPPAGSAGPAEVQGREKTRGVIRVLPVTPINAVMVGAVQFGLNPRVVSSRIAKMTFGIKCVRECQKTDENKDKLITRGGKTYEPYFYVLCRSGDSVGVDQRAKGDFRPIDDQVTQVPIILLATKQRHIVDPNDEGVISLGALDLPLAARDGAERPILVEFVFGSTEIQVAVFDGKTSEVRPAVRGVIEALSFDMDTTQAFVTKRDA
jgi:hypothetical protein